MGELVQWLLKEVAQPTMHPLKIAALLHYKFLRIHPFDDGNGRLSRLLMNYVLLRFGFPPVVVKSSDKKSYLLALNEADAGNLDAFVEYVSNLLLSSLTFIYEAISTNQLEEDAEEYLSPTNQKYKQYLQRGI